MTCRACGATIADKAIVCYRCGAPTAAPSPPAVQPRPAARRRFPGGALVLVVLGLLTLVASLTLPSAEENAQDVMFGQGQDVLLMRLAGLALAVLGGVRLLMQRRR